MFAIRRFHLSIPSHLSRKFPVGRAMSTQASKLGANHTAMKNLTIDRINPHIRQVEYAVRGELAIRAEQLKQDLVRGELPFKEIVNCNIGNPQQLQQKPITFFRQVASLVEYPELLLPENRDKVSALYPSDAIERAALLLQHIGNIGAYSHSQGIPHIRQNVSRFIEDRDGHPANPDHIFLTQGASAGVQMILQLLVEHSNVGIMIPTPQYPLYSATLAQVGARAVPYFLEEEQGWGLSVEELQRSLEKARNEGADVRALCIINPGNPTGQCLTADNMREIIDLCRRERLVLLADEVYQTNIYAPQTRPFHSFKRIVRDMGADDVELFSFHSISKGMIGECGRRGGYFECVGIDNRVLEEIYKIASVSLCPNVQGQIMVDLMVNPPKKNDPSFALYDKEIRGIYESLKRRSKRLCELFNRLEGVTCNDAEGAMYLFPQVQLPEGAIRAAKEANRQPDEFYCLKMLEATGVCVVPGSGFGQKAGTWHFRSTFLPPEHQFDAFCGLLEDFHRNFMDKYRV
ncbi:uncharacterized protein VTP21DRAFT_755 [Calcarisporiella thermophila]|uniref:uncharacterized protein n=1 Tax=Calcarisporiella thermophila TaxID=911321 RepID=UPI0037448311